MRKLFFSFTLEAKSYMKKMGKLVLPQIIFIYTKKFFRNPKKFLGKTEKT